MEWFRFYQDAIDDVKVQQLSGDDFKGWVNLLCVACKQDAGGVLPGVGEIAFRLRITDERAQSLLVSMEASGLVDRFGDRYKIHSWDGRQKPSDSSAERVRRHYQRTHYPADSLADAVPNVSLTPQIREDKSREEETRRIPLYPPFENESGESPEAIREVGVPPTPENAISERESNPAPVLPGFPCPPESGAVVGTDPKAEAKAAALRRNSTGRAAEPAAKPASRKAPAHPLPEGFCLGEKQYAWAAERGVSNRQADMLTERFCNYWRSKGGLMVDWFACWRNWILKEIEQHPERYTAPPAAAKPGASEPAAPPIPFDGDAYFKRMNAPSPYRHLLKDSLAKRFGAAS